MKMKKQFTRPFGIQVVLTMNFIAMSAFIKTLERSKINSLRFHLKLLENQEQANSKINRWKEIIQIRAEISKMETKRTIQSISETKSWFIEKINKIDILLDKLTKRQRKKTQINKIRDE
jgi:hypothetical protein